MRSNVPAAKDEGRGVVRERCPVAGSGARPGRSSGPEQGHWTPGRPAARSSTLVQ